MGMTAAVLHAAQQQGGSIWKKGCSRIEENGIEFVALK
jgi:hypothetical protein